MLRPGWVRFGLALSVVALTLSGCRVLAAQTEPVTPTANPQVARGAQLYVTYCQQCHGDRDGNGRIPNAPPHTQDGHTWMHSDNNLLDIILNGSGQMGDMMRQMQDVPADAPRMPAWKGTLSPDDARAIIAFLKTWWTPDQRRQQADTPMMR